MTDDPRIADLKAALAVADMRYEGIVAIANGLREDLRQAHRDYIELATRLTTPTLTTMDGTVAMEEPDVPPPEVLAAIQAISPTRDKTYEANWGFWERNKDRAKAHPEDFAAEILRGAT